MKRIKVNYTIWYLLVFYVFISCNSEGTDSLVENNFPENSLAALIGTNNPEIDNVIACAAGSEDNPDEIIAFVYPRPGVNDIRFFETENAQVDKNDFAQYQQINLPEEDFFNGYLRMFKRITPVEKWVILTFFDNGVLNISNPIRLKHKSTLTEYTNNVSIDNTNRGMPVFEWQDGAVDENAIYFQVISDERDELLSGTYTFESVFQYYILDNVVLNITEETPPILIPNAPYHLTLMGVSEDNWVNLFIQERFIN